jgi:serine/threonine protein kinase
MPSPDVGRVLGGYRLIRVLGEGGMGVVYEAEDVSLGRTVALKQIRPGLARNASFLRRFRTEARALARIKSPSIVGIHALREVDEGLLIDMEYVDGPTLKEHLRNEGALSWETAIPVMQNILQAFVDAHEAGIIHRDVKPQNVMLPSEGGVKVTDFGLARMHDDGDETVTRGIAGTLKYMSPEQVRDSADLDARSDLFSLGIVFFEMLTGRLPYDAEATDYEVMRTIADEDLPGPRAVDNGIPEALDRIVRRLLQRDPDDRYPSARHTLRALTSMASQAGAGRDTAEGTAKESLDANGQASEDASARDQPTSYTTTAILMGVGVLTVFGALAYVFWPSASSSLSVQTTPAGATVYAGETRLGVTPLTRVDLAENTLALRIERDGYEPVDTFLTVQGASILDVDLRPAADDRRGAIQIDSSPSGAQVYLGDSLLGTTPLSSGDLRPGRTELRLELDGFESALTSVHVQSAHNTDLGLIELQPTETANADQTDRDPDPSPREEAPASTATLRLSVPGGSAVVQGQTIHASGTVSVDAGSQRVEYRHPAYGTRTETLTLDAGETVDRTFYFEQPVTVNTIGSWGNVWIDGENRGNTPFRGRLGPGRHEIELRINRSDAFTIQGGTWNQRTGEEADAVQPFSGASVVVDIEPGFEETTHVLSFTIERASSY